MWTYPDPECEPSPDPPDTADCNPPTGPSCSGDRAESALSGCASPAWSHNSVTFLLLAIPAHLLDQIHLQQQEGTQTGNVKLIPKFSSTSNIWEHLKHGWPPVHRLVYLTVSIRAVRQVKDSPLAPTAPLSPSWPGDPCSPSGPGGPCWPACPSTPTSPLLPKKTMDQIEFSLKHKNWVNWSVLK